MTKNHRNQEPEPVRSRFARLFRRRPTIAERSRAALVAADPAGAFVSGMRQAEPLRNGDALAAILRQAEALRLAREEAARWREHADAFAREAEARETERDHAYRERAQLLAWLAALHPSTAVITASPDVDEDGWQLLYLVAGGWQMSWHIHPRDAALFRHVTVVDVTDPRAQWDGHGSEQKYQRMRQHVRLLALDGLGDDGASTGVTPEVRSA
ncbi:hypothetical protein [Streptomyces sp. NPDC057877]|uniref:hypothetical protein n=1 Tax=Streptomyces sp. NPDC057877 TaxID=3346269 RepID=UPI003674B9F1